MQLKENVWYILDREYDREKFIDDLCCATRIMKSQMLLQHPEVKTAKVIKYKQKSVDPVVFDINYRTEFKPDYLTGPREHYSLIDNSTIKEWVDARIADIERNKTELKPTTFTINTACGQSDLSRHVDSWLDTTKKLMIDKQQNIMTKIYEGDNNMTCSNEYNEKYLIQQYFEVEEKKLTEEKIKAENDLLKNTALYKAAETFITEANSNKGYKCAPDIKYLIKDYLNESQRNALIKLNEKYNEEVEEVRKKCKVVESLINMCDNADQKMDILRRYEIIKLPKMPK